VKLKWKDYEGAYYLGGYAVECALKACIAKRAERHEFPDKQDVIDSYTHDFKEMVRLAHLREYLKEARRNDPFDTNWTAV
jgi:hypothetical protein